MSKELTSFDKAFKELNEIASQLEAQNLPIDKIAEKVERAAELSNFCKTRLRQIENKLDELKKDGDLE